MSTNTTDPIATWPGQRALWPLLVLLALLAFGPVAAGKDDGDIDEEDRVVLRHNAHPLATAESEVGRADLNLPGERIILALRMSAAQRAGLKRLLAQQKDPASPNYHKWLTPEEFGARFGPTTEQIERVRRWLRRHGFKVDEVARSRMWVNFSGSIAQVEQAFRTEIREYRVEGRRHLANARDPSIPRALAAVVAGTVSLHNFPRRPLHAGARPLAPTAIGPSYTSSSGKHYLSPNDFALIYNLDSLYAQGIDGTGQTVAIVSRSRPPASNWSTFRSLMGLSDNPPQVIINGTDPGDLGGMESTEADLDVEWAGAVARNARIAFVTSKSTGFTDGVDLSAQFIVDNNLAPVMSTSYGACEARLGTTANAFYNNLWAQAAAQGITSFVASGDSGSAGCQRGSDSSGTGLAVSGLASTPHNVAVGGTQFDEGAGTYWNSSNGSGYASALSYIPEVAWNESVGMAGGAGLWATGGGKSSLYARPAWQVAPGVPEDGARAIPDVSLTAAMHDGYLVQTQGGLYAVGGTSASAPAFAGIMALIVQKTGQRQGNANFNFYPLAAAQYGGSGPVVFHDITSGGNAVPGVSAYSCTAGYDLATGLGSVDAYALVHNWGSASPDFALAAAPTAVAVEQGGTATSTITTTPLRGFDATVALAAAGLPAGVGASFSPEAIAAPGAGSSTLSLGVDPAAATGSYTLTVTGSAGGTSHAAVVALTVTSGSVPLSVAATGSGSGTVTSSPAGIACGSDCAESYATGTTVTLSASADSSSVFTGWGGDCAGSAVTCILGMTAARSVTANFNRKAEQSIGAVSFTPATLVVGGTTTASATASSGLPVSFSALTPAVCSVDGATVTAIAAGTCTVAADQAGDANYNAAPQVSGSIDVAKAGQSIGAIDFSPATLAVGGTTTASATASSGLAVSFSSLTPTVCASGGAAGGSVTALAAGTCTVAADQAGNATFDPAPQVTRSITVDKASQSIGAIGFDPATLVVGATTSASAVSSAGLAVSFSSLTPAVCTSGGADGASVTASAAGLCTVAADQAGSADYYAAPRVTRDLVVGKGSQSIGTVALTPDVLVVGGSSTLSAATSAGLAVSFSSATPAVCHVDGGTVTAIAAGTCVVFADQAGDANYQAAAQVAWYVTVGKGSQGIGEVGLSPATLVVGSSSTADATSSAGLAVSFSSATPTICATSGVNGSTVTGVAAGTCVILANQAGDANYNAAPQVARYVTVDKSSQSIGAVALSPDVLVVGSSSTISAGTSAGLAVRFSSATPAVCATSGINDSTVTGIAAGTCVIFADQAGDANYQAAPQVARYVTVGKGGQSIGAVGLSPDTLVVGSSSTANASTSAGLAVSFSSATPAVCATSGVNGSTVTGIAAGTCVIFVDQAGDANYQAAPQVARYVTVGKGGQSIGAVGLSPDTLVVGSSSTVGATSSAGLTVSFSSATPAVCAISGVNGSTVTGIAAGTCVIFADQAGDANYQAAPQVARYVTVGKGSQSIGGIGFTPATLVVGGSTTVGATASSGLAVGFSSATPAVCTTSGSSVSALAAGICTVVAAQAGDANYHAAPSVSQGITVGKGSQSISGIGFNPATLVVGGTTSVRATATTSLAVSFSSATPAVCTTDGSRVTALAAGTCTVVAEQAGDANYHAAPQVAQSITVGKGSQSIGGIDFTPATLVVGGSTTVGATASSGLAVGFSSATPAVCTTSGSSVSALAAGTCTVVAEQAGDANYHAAPSVSQDITVGKGSQSISGIGFNPATLVVGGTTSVSATATTGLAVSFSSATPAVCTTDGSRVTALAAGTCTVIADQAGDANYHAAPQVAQSITVGKGSQSIGGIDFTPATLVVGGSTTVGATASSGLAVGFNSATPAVCTTSGSSVSAVAAGTCTVVAAQAGDANYHAAPSVSQDITVGKGSQSISGIGFNPATLVVGGTTTLDATATTGLAVSFSSATPAVCTTDGSSVTALAAGTCVVVAAQAGDANYHAAPQVAQSITVGKGSQSIGGIGFTPQTLLVGGTATLDATATTGLAVSFSSATPAVCTTDGSSVTALAAGTCVVVAAQAGDANYHAAPQVAQSITVGKGSQRIGGIGFAPDTLAMGGTTTISASATSGLAVSFSSATPAVCTTDGSRVTALAAGTCVVVAAQAGNADYQAAPPLSQGITVDKAGQSIGAMGFSPATVAVGGTTTVTAAASSGLAVRFSTATPAVCTVGGPADTTVSALAAGTCTVVADQAGNADYHAAPTLTAGITVAKAKQGIGAIDLTPATLRVGGTTTASAAATSGLPVTFSSLTPDICAVDAAGSVTAVAAGTCTVAADQAGDAAYKAAPPVRKRITVYKATQGIGAIGFTPTTLRVGGTTTASAAATSGLPVTFSSLTPAICTVDAAGSVTAVAAGTCTVAADQAGDAAYKAAPPVRKRITVYKATQGIGAIDFTPATLRVGGTTLASAVATSGLPVTFSSLTPAICTVDAAGSVTAVAAGTCTVATDQAGSANYKAAPQVRKRITVRK